MRDLSLTFLLLTALALALPASGATNASNASKAPSNTSKGNLPSGGITSAIPNATNASNASNNSDANGSQALPPASALPFDMAFAIVFAALVVGLLVYAAARPRTPRE
ncbi:MAG: hypothetical protein ACYDDF_12105 [Thermoplasmatota archaeon]